MVSGGGGAELVSEDEARAAIRRGEAIAIDKDASLQNLIDLRFEREPAKTAPYWYAVALAYRQAGMFVGYVRDLDRPAFDHMLAAILDGKVFADAVIAGYHDDLHALWQGFVESRTDQQ
jgi:hypothetical protein